MRKELLLIILAVTPLVAFGNVVAPDLGAALPFGLLGGTISNTGTSLVTGDVGAVTTITGFPPGTATGTVYPAPSDPTVSAAYSDFLTAFSLAYSDISTPTTQLVTDLTTDRTFRGDNVFYFLLTDVVSTANINLSFDAQNDSNAVFIIKIARDLTINGPLTFDLQRGARADHIYWVVGRSATISSGGGAVDFDGNILAGSTFTMSANPGGSGVLAGTIDGCVFAQNANTLAGRTNVGGCVNAGSAVPEPDSATLVACACFLGLALRHAKRRKQFATSGRTSAI
ncbi:MAG: ice-binding family protein [Candidatus Solibacter sp.]